MPNNHLVNSIHYVIVNWLPNQFIYVNFFFFFKIPTKYMAKKSIYILI